MLRRGLTSALVTLLCFGLLAPIIVVVIVSFSGDGYLRFPPQSLSLQWYDRFLADDRWRNALVNSLYIAGMTTVAATLLGALAAYAMLRADFPAKQVLLAFLLMPLIVPHIIQALAVYFLSSPLGLLGFKPWIALAHAVIGLPVVLVIMQSALRAVDPNLERAAMICGCGRAGVLRRVVLPIALPGIISASLFAFLTSFDELMISLFLAGVRSETLPVRIWHSLLLEVEPTIAAVSSLLIAVTVLALLADWALRGARRA